ncbi:DUF3179 domain-containing protein [Gimesia aquarii]|uniref:DUF3179 domain-containing protein n=1 Tax=Gimesia aquarii TaxID=2527964 RepID=A0A517VW41_9PLAN|nr:DUF3179 domain-containing protein [Gimesia aquarii]QDT97222.1 hypothetical protein V144x_26940 [Gimesia aquarii]
MESSPQHDSNSNSEVPEPLTDEPTTQRSRPQKPLLLFAVLGISFAGWYGWNHRAEIVAVCLNQSVVQARGAGSGPRNPEDAGFNTEGLTLPNDQVRNGGVPKDGIPALTNPKFMTVAEATFMKPADRLAGVIFEGQARAYPLKIMDMHEAVNDKIGETSFVVTYCPLCDSLAVYNRKGTGGEIEFGISGFLYNSNVLLYDRTGSGKTDGLWSQLMSQSVAGPRVKEKLITLPVELTTWEDWKQRYPQTQVLSTDTGHPRDYQNRAYAGYFSNDALMFDVNKHDDRLSNKTPLLGIWVGDQKRAYPVTAFAHLTKVTEIEQELAGKKFTLVYNPNGKTLRVVNADQDLRWMYSFWFAWYAFYPEAELYASTTAENKDAVETKQPETTLEKKETP